MLAAQARLGVRNQIKGEIVEKALGADSIYFSFGSINSKYYEHALEPSKLTANQYAVNNSLNYPQMYKISFLTDKNIRPWREGNYFIDPSTTIIKTNFNFGNCSETNGVTGKEYQSRFIPFVTTGVIYDCRSDYLFDLFNDSNHKADSILLNYIKAFPDSYVALWKLIERFSSYGQSSIRQQALASFSTEMKQGVLWNKLDKDFKGTKIKEGEVFPDVALKQ